MSALCLQLLEAKRWRVLAADDMDFWRDIVIDLMSHKEGGTFKEGRVSRWIVWPPRFHNLWSSLTCVTHFRPDWRLGYRRLHIGEHSDRMPPNTHDPEMEKKNQNIRVRRDAHFKKNKNLTPLNHQHHPHSQHSSTKGQKTKCLQAQRRRQEEGFILFYLKVLYFNSFNF